MANIKSAEKRNRQRLQRRERNLHHLSTMRTYVKRVRTALDAKGDAAKALELAQKAVRSCLAQSGTRPDEINQIFVVTTTGLTTPSLDALLAGCLGLRADVRRSPLFGLGCAGGAGAECAHAARRGRRSSDGAGAPRGPSESLRFLSHRSAGRLRQRAVPPPDS